METYQYIGIMCLSVIYIRSIYAEYLGDLLINYPFFNKLFTCCLCFSSWFAYIITQDIYMTGIIAICSELLNNYLSTQGTILK